MGGMITATVLAVFFVPVFFVVVRRFFKGSERQRQLYARARPQAARHGGSQTMSSAVACAPACARHRRGAVLAGCSR